MVLASFAFDISEPLPTNIIFLDLLIISLHISSKSKSASTTTKSNKSLEDNILKNSFISSLDNSDKSYAVLQLS